MMADLHMTIDGFYSFLDAASFFRTSDGQSDSETGYARTRGRGRTRKRERLKFNLTNQKT
jgi:hypothetical protein